MTRTEATPAPSREFWNPSATLLDGERILCFEAPSGPALLGAWRIEAALFLIAMAMLGATSILPRQTAVVAAVLIAAAVAGATLKFTRWSQTYYLITTERVLVVWGTLARHHTSIPLHQIRRARAQSRQLSRLLGYGSVVLTVGATPRRFRIERVRRPKRLATLIADVAELDRDG